MPGGGCTYRDTFRLAMGEETSGSAARAAILRDEHPDHPAQGQSESPADSN